MTSVRRKMVTIETPHGLAKRRRHRTVRWLRISGLRVSSAQVGQERHRLCSKALDFVEALLVGADEVDNDVTGAGVVEAPDRVDHLLRTAKRAVALGGLAEVHGVARAETPGRGLQRVLVGAVDARE